MNFFSNDRKSVGLLIFGDFVTIVAVTIAGFASHGTLLSAGTRILTTFIPLVLAWFLVAPFFGLYHIVTVIEIRQLWRPLYISLIIAPLAAWFRGIMLNAPILPLFIAILCASIVVGFLIWRLIFLFLYMRLK